MMKIMNRVGAVAGILFLLSILDIFVSGYREPDTFLRALRGDKIPISGVVSGKIDSLDQLVFKSDSPLLDMRFEGAEGATWQGELFVAKGLDVGEYGFTVTSTVPVPRAAKKTTADYRVHVYPDAASYRNASFSLFERIIGFSPWLIVIPAFPIMLIALALSFRDSTRREAELNTRGAATIFKVTRTKTECEINLGLGSRHGVEEGEILGLLDRRRRYVGTATVKKVRDDYCQAIVEPGLKVVADDLAYRVTMDPFASGEVLFPVES